eukprot:4712540-Pyramimonas_sp.AAC.1
MGSDVIEGASEESAFYSHIWPPRIQLEPLLEEWGTLHVNANGPCDPFEFEPYSEIFTDVSCFDPEIRHLARA